MDVTIPYKPNKLVMVAVIVFFGLSTFVLANLAMEGDKGLSLFRVINLEPDAARIAYWALCSASAFFVLGALASMVFSQLNPREIVFREAELQFPKKVFSKEYANIPYVDILNTNEMSVKGTRIYNVYYSDGKISLSTSMVSGKKDYELFKSELMRRINSQR